MEFFNYFKKSYPLQIDSNWNIHRNEIYKDFEFIRLNDITFIFSASNLFLGIELGVDVNYGDLTFSVWKGDLREGNWHWRRYENEDSPNQNLLYHTSNNIEEIIEKIKPILNPDQKDLLELSVPDHWKILINELERESKLHANDLFNTKVVFEANCSSKQYQYAIRVFQVVENGNLRYYVSLYHIRHYKIDLEHSFYLENSFDVQNFINDYLFYPPNFLKLSPKLKK